MTERKTVLSLYAQTMYLIQFCTTPWKTTKMLSFDYLQSSKQYLACLQEKTTKVKSIYAFITNTFSIS